MCILIRPGLMSIFLTTFSMNFCDFFCFLFVTALSLFPLQIHFSFLVIFQWFQVLSMSVELDRNRHQGKQNSIHKTTIVYQTANATFIQNVDYSFFTLAFDSLSSFFFHFVFLCAFRACALLCLLFGFFQWFFFSNSAFFLCLEFHRQTKWLVLTDYVECTMFLEYTIFRWHCTFHQTFHNSKHTFSNHLVERQNVKKRK